jgi:hypothetical protein
MRRRRYGARRRSRFRRRRGGRFRYRNYLIPFGPTRYLPSTTTTTANPTTTTSGRPRIRKPDSSEDWRYVPPHHQYNPRLEGNHPFITQIAAPIINALGHVAAAAAAGAVARNGMLMPPNPVNFNNRIMRNAGRRIDEIRPTDRVSNNINPIHFDDAIEARR